jgi:hypothetical protein
MNTLHRLVRNAVSKLTPLAGADRQLVLSGKLLAAAHLQKPTIDDLTEVEFRVFSQFGEDGIVEWLVSVLPIASNTFVEFGVEDYRESNTRFLLMNRNWRGLVLDGDARNIAAFHADDIAYKHDITAVASFITADNINGSIEHAGFGERIGLLSVDLDGIDWWVLKAVNVAADIVIVEYNHFLGDLPVTVPYAQDFVRSKAHWSNGYWGASLAAFKHLLAGRGYVFVGTNAAGCNAFFVRTEHETVLRVKLRNVRAHPGVIRDARNKDGGLAYTGYRQFLPDMASLPLVRVDTMEPTTVAAALLRS